MTGTVFDIKEMAVHDGPGIRTTVFLKGCPLRCLWCHNPEGLSAAPQLMFKENKCRRCGLCFKPCAHEECKPFGRCVHICPENCLEIAGRRVEAKALAAELKKSAAVLGDTFGGFTFSGGEPLFQPDFLLDLINELSGYNLCIETSGYAKSEIFGSVIDKLDFVIMDIKLYNGALHKKYTGVDNALILENFSYLKASGKPHIIRTPLIPGITDTPENLAAIEKAVGESVWEKLPYNALAGAKYKMLGMEYKL
ncbi:MAG: glycyl-radical enzyme activating protein [Clostridia bacterium]|nr:glycyl-radical enzyme activating protein [Clostridia bacterium]